MKTNIGCLRHQNFTWEVAGTSVGENPRWVLFHFWEKHCQPRQKLILRSSAFISVLHFTVTITVESLTMSITHTIKRVWNDIYSVAERYSLLASVDKRCIWTSLSFWCYLVNRIFILVLLIFYVFLYLNENKPCA
jgi:hypothetical protein